MKKILTFGATAILALSISCAHKGSIGRETRAGTLIKKDNAFYKIRDAQSLYDLGEIEASIASLRTFVDNNAYNPSHDRAYELIIEWLLQLKRYEEAKKLASYFLSNNSESKSVQKIIDLFDKAPQKTEEQETKTKKENHYEDQPIETEDEHLLDLENSFSQASDTLTRQEGYKKLSDYILYDMPFDTVKNLTKQKNRGLIFGLAQLRLARHSFHIFDYKKSLEHLEQGKAHVGPSEIAPFLAIEEEIHRLSQVNSKSLGIVLPLSGPFAPFGNKALAAMSLALDLPIATNGQEISVFVKNTLRMVVADSKGDPLQALRMIDSLVKDHHVAMVIGEITPASSLALAERCQQLGVPIISLSRLAQMKFDWR